MTSYIAITDTETDPEAPLTATLAKKWRDNPIAIGEGDASVPTNLRPRVLLGTLNTTSGTTQTLSGLNLTNYKNLEFILAGVGQNSNTAYLHLYSSTAPYRISTTVTSSFQRWWGIGNLELATGIAVFNVFTGSLTDSQPSASSAVVVTPYSTTSTSISFLTSNIFDEGFIRVLGIK